MKRLKTIPLFFFIAFLILIAPPILIFPTNKALAVEGETAPIDLEEIKEGFNYTFKSLGYINIQDPADSTLNPDNDFLKIPRHQFNFELRPDLSLELRRLKLVVKPRLTIEHQRWEDGHREGDHDTDDDWYINEWLISLRLFDGLFASYGRENLQWGPSYLISPSNPFFRDNGKSNPKREIPGMDFARLVWVSNNSFSASFIANTHEGRQEFLADFEPTYALKIDHTNDRKYASVVASYREEDRARLGAYAGWTVSSALMIYGEASVSQGTDGLYPVKDPGTPFGISMRPLKDDENSPEGIVLLGGSYTFEIGPTLTAEYIFNSAGYDDDEADLYYELRRQASRTYHFPGPITLASRLALT
ncbi:MAG: hypothetical protein SV375_10645, partial [Thermodesulfobacteriota bacterium]|nr:hypothetical protein [Thermodesulfobacteriota bacterium]